MHLTPSRRRRIVGACAAALVLPLAVTAGTASAAPALPTPPAPPPVTLAVPGVATLSMKPGAVPAVTAPALAPAVADPHGAKIVGIAERPSPGQFDVAIWSPAMNRNILVHVLAPPGYDRAKNPAVTYPVVYLLDGLRAPNTTSDWVNQGGAVDFFKDKNALVVMSVGGGGSFFQNWAANDPALLALNNDPYLNPGPQASKLGWETFLTNELPGVIEAPAGSPAIKGFVNIGGNQNRAIAGLSMGGYSAFNLAAKHPGMYEVAASYSGFPDSQAPGLPEFLQYVLSQQIGVTNPDNLWGPSTNPLWTVNNPAGQANIASLKSQVAQGLSLYMSAGTGLHGAHDAPLGFGGLSSEFVGSILEVVANYSSQSFNQVATLNNLPIATVDLSRPGIHSWGYWNDQLKYSWPQIAKAIHVTA